MSKFQNKKLAYKCARCFTEDALKLAWFCGKNSIWADSLLCRICFNKAFNQLTEETKKEYWWYDNKK